MSNETPQDTVLVSAEGSTTKSLKETADIPPMVKETKNSEEVTLPTVQVSEEPKTSDDMETDAPQKESNAA